MLDISITKVAQVIVMSRELGRAEAELLGFLDALNDDERVALVALMWIGRGAFAPDDLEEALEVARTEAHVPTADYLLGSPHLSDHLENGLEALGLSALDEEEALMR